MDIFAKYLDISTLDIQECLSRNKLICSPLRTDNNPTCGFYYKGGKLRMNDFAGYFHGDCYDVIGYKYYLNTKDSQDFARILNIIAKDFGIWHYDKSKNTKVPLSLAEEIKRDKKLTIIDVQPRLWDEIDIRYWGKYSLEIDDVVIGDVVPVYSYWINGQLVYNTSYADICYGYYGGERKEDGAPLWQLYHPFRKEAKFITNYAALRAKKLISKNEIGVLTKSVKDALVLYKLGVSTASLGAESMFPTKIELNKLDSIWNTKVIFTDFDYAGIRMANMLKKVSYQPIFLTTGKANSIDYRAKDISDFIERYKYKKTKELVEYLLEERDYTSRDYHDFIHQTFHL